MDAAPSPSLGLQAESYTQDQSETPSSALVPMAQKLEVEDRDLETEQGLVGTEERNEPEPTWRSYQDTGKKSPRVANDSPTCLGLIGVRKLLAPQRWGVASKKYQGNE